MAAGRPEKSENRESGDAPEIAQIPESARLREEKIRGYLAEIYEKISQNASQDTYSVDSGITRAYLDEIYTKIIADTQSDKNSVISHHLESMQEKVSTALIEIQTENSEEVVRGYIDELLAKCVTSTEANAAEMRLLKAFIEQIYAKTQNQIISDHVNELHASILAGKLAESRERILKDGLNQLFFKAAEALKSGQKSGEVDLGTLK